MRIARFRCLVAPHHLLLPISAVLVLNSYSKAHKGCCSLRRRLMLLPLTLPCRCLRYCCRTCFAASISVLGGPLLAVLPRPLLVPLLVPHLVVVLMMCGILLLSKVMLAQDARSFGVLRGEPLQPCLAR